VSYGAKQILSEISFDIHEGDIVGLLGLNGAGKSTLLKVLSGAMAPNHGTVQIGDHELFTDTTASRMHIGYAPDKPAIYPEFSVTEFLHFIARMRRIEKHRIKACINKVIERCALGDAQKRIIGNLSTGYQQRVNIAQALIHTPKILILDEPANGLDPVQLIDLRTLITTLAEDQATVFSSHLLPEVSSVCNRVILINNGEQILNAPMESLTNKSNSSFEIRLNGNYRPYCSQKACKHRKSIRWTTTLKVCFNTWLPPKPAILLQRQSIIKVRQHDHADCATRTEDPDAITICVAGSRFVTTHVWLVVSVCS